MRQDRPRRASCSTRHWCAACFRPGLSISRCSICRSGMSKQVDGGEILERIQECLLYRYGMDETMIITRSNKRANRFNEGVRRNVLFAEEEIGSGDMLMVVKNNYHYTGEQQQQDRQENSEQQSGGMDFIANGDTALLCAASAGSRIFTGSGLRDAQPHVPRLRFDMELDCQILLDTLSSESPVADARAGQPAVPGRRGGLRGHSLEGETLQGGARKSLLQRDAGQVRVCRDLPQGAGRPVDAACSSDRMLFGEEAMTPGAAAMALYGAHAGDRKAVFYQFRRAVFRRINEYL